MKELNKTPRHHVLSPDTDGVSSASDVSMSVSGVVSHPGDGDREANPHMGGQWWILNR